MTDAAWRVIRLDGGPDETAVPELDLGLVRSARYGQSGARLQLCDGLTALTCLSAPWSERLPTGA